jgi:hypothetical protein
MVRNFKNVNNFHQVQTLFDLYITGHFESIFIAMAIMSNRGDRIIIQKIDPNKSNILLTIMDHQSNFECLYSRAIIFCIISGL